MQDFVPYGAGNSRYLRSNIPIDITLEQLVALLRSGQFPIDLAGINPEGVAQRGTALNKANLLSDTTAELLGLTVDPTINDALVKLAAMAMESPYVTGFYIGNGTAQRKIELGFTPSAVHVAHVVEGDSRISSVSSSTFSFQIMGGLAVRGANVAYTNTPSAGVVDTWSNNTVLMITEGGFFVNYTTGTPRSNSNGYGYTYIAFR